MKCYNQKDDGFSIVVNSSIMNGDEENLHGGTRHYAKDIDEETMENIKFLKAATLEIQLRESQIVSHRRLPDINIKDLSELIDTIGDLLFKQGAQILGENAFEFIQPSMDEEAVAHI